MSDGVGAVQAALVGDRSRTMESLGRSTACRSRGILAKIRRFGRSVGVDPTEAGAKMSGSQRSGRSSAWLERYVRDVEVAGSNPVAPTFKALNGNGLRTGRSGPLRPRRPGPLNGPLFCNSERDVSVARRTTTLSGRPSVLEPLRERFRRHWELFRRTPRLVQLFDFEPASFC